VLTTAGYAPQVNATRPFLPRYVAEAPARKVRINEKNVGCDDGNIEEFLILDLLTARSHQFDHDLPRA